MHQPRRLSTTRAAVKGKRNNWPPQGCVRFGFVCFIICVGFPGNDGRPVTEESRPPDQ
jgi:hypothetical protein